MSDAQLKWLAGFVLALWGAYQVFMDLDARYKKGRRYGWI
jgi:hypothetical protein